MIIREYKPSDCEILAKLFYDTVHLVNIKDYTEEQVSAWATGEVDLTAWNDSFLEHYTVVAEEDGVIVGFGISLKTDISTDCMFTRTISIKGLEQQFAMNWKRA